MLHKWYFYEQPSKNRNDNNGLTEVDIRSE